MPRPVISPTIKDSGKPSGIDVVPGVANLTIEWMKVPLSFEQSRSNLPGFVREPPGPWA